jgi:hypothetical protein
MSRLHLTRRGLVTKTATFPTITRDKGLQEVASNLLLKCDGDNGSIVLTDDSINNLQFTRVGNAQISTEQSKFGGSSAKFDGSGDHFTTPYNSQFDLGIDNWTLELWYYPLTVTGDKTLIMINSHPSSSYASIRIAAANAQFRLLCANPSSTWINANLTANVLTANQWHHIAATRNGSTFTLWVNGINRLSYTSTVSLYNPSGATVVGQDPSTAASSVNGYIDSVRFIKNTVVYTANFTPPTEELTNTVMAPTIVTNNIYGVNQRY